MKSLWRLIITAAVIIFLIWLFRPDFFSSAGNTLLKSVGSRASGSAQVLPDAQKQNTAQLQVRLQGLAAQNHYVVSLHDGSCSGKTLFVIGTTSADGSGSINSNFSLKNLKDLSRYALWMSVNEGGSNGKEVACGQVSINSTDITQLNVTPPAPTVSPSPQNSNSSNQNAKSNSQKNVGGFPQTGTAPGDDGSYDNYNFPRKY